VRYFYNAWHADHDKAPWWAWAAAAAAIICAFGVASLASPGMRGLMGLADLSAPAAVAGRPEAPPEVADVVMTRCMMCHAAAPMDWIGQAPKGCSSIHRSISRSLRPLFACKRF
jgi:uncharacterized membrane protein